MNLSIHKFNKGDIWVYKDNIEDKQQGERGIMRGSRPVLVLSNTEISEYTNIVTIAPITSKKHEEWTDRIEISLNPRTNSYIAMENIFTAPSSRLGMYIGHLSDSVMRIVDKKLIEIFHLEQNFNQHQEEEYSSDSSLKIFSSRRIVKSDEVEHPREYVIVNKTKSTRTKYSNIYCEELSQYFNSVAEISNYLQVSKPICYKNIKSGKPIKGFHFYIKSNETKEGETTND